MLAYMFVDLYVDLFAYMFVGIHVDLFVGLFVCLFVSLVAYLFVGLCVAQFVNLFVGRLVGNFSQSYNELRIKFDSLTRDEPTQIPMEGLAWLLKPKKQLICDK